MNLTQYWNGVSAALGIGGIVGFVAGRVSVEGKMRAEYAESVEILKNTFEKTRTEAPVVDDLELEDDFDFQFKVEAPVPSYEPEINESGEMMVGSNLSSLTMDHQPQPFVEMVLDKTPDPMHSVSQRIEEGIQLATVHETDYHKAIDAIETPVELFVSGGVNDYGVSYIEDSEFEEANGFEKIRIDIMIDDHNPLFLMEGQAIDDWDKRLGDSILIDFFRLVPPGAPPVLYVRNHAAGEDYEVVRVEP
jgi:hypothetical protein